MIELAFHKDLYDAGALGEATTTYARFGTLEQVDDGARWLVRVTAGSPARERRIADELSNFALGLTIERASAGNKEVTP